MKKVLITGISGFLGWNLWKHIQDDYLVFGTYNSNHHLAPLPNMFQLDLRDEATTTALLHKIKPNIIMNTAAYSSIAACEKDYAATQLLNVQAVKTLAQYCATNNAKLLQCSTDMVFDGKKGNYAEHDKTNPINDYGLQKSEAETILAALHSSSLIMRLPLMIGESPYSTSGVVADLKTQAVERGFTEVFVDEYRSAALVMDVCLGIKICIEKNIEGIVHIAGAAKLNRQQIAEYVQKAYNIHHLAVRPTTHQAKGINNRPKDVSLNIDKLRALGYKPTNLF